MVTRWEKPQKIAIISSYWWFGGSIPLLMVNSEVSWRTYQLADDLGEAVDVHFPVLGAMEFDMCICTYTLSIHNIYIMCTVCLYVHIFFPPGSLLRYAAADETADYVLSQNWLSLSQNGYGCVCEYIYICICIYIYTLLYNVYLLVCTCVIA
jgi:hypothetical protein